MGALVTKVFDPSRTQSPWLSTAVVARARALDPESGSVIPVAPITLPSASRGSHSCFCSSVPNS